MPTGPDTTAAAGSGPAAKPPAGAGGSRPRAGAGEPSGPERAPTATGHSAGTEPGPAASATSGPATAARAGRRRRAAALVRREIPRTVAAVLAGVALVLAFPPYDLWPLSFAAVAVLSALTHRRSGRQGAWTGLVLGTAFFVGLLKWLNVVGWDAVIGLSFLQAVFFGALGAGLAVTSRLPAWPLWGACLWVAEEWARDRTPFGGFPWGRLAFANTDSPFTPLAALGGAPLVTFAVALTGTLLAAAALTSRKLRPAAAPSGGRRRAAFRIAAGGALAAALASAGYAVPVPTKAADTVDIAVVQGDVQKPGMDFLGRPMMILDNHAEATLRLAERIEAGEVPRPDLVIWPENASDLDPFKYQAAHDRIEEAVDAVGVPILVGALVDHPTEEGYVENQGIVWTPRDGPGASYTKQHPVPFGEYVPFRDVLSTFISRLERIPRDFWPGDHTGVLQVGPARLGDVICFEIAYDEIVRDTVNDGARALVVQTNNATYGRTGQPEQQLAMSRLRAVEHGRAVVTAATSGISAIVAPDGTVTQRTREFTQDVLRAELPLRDDITPADRVGPAPEWTLAIVGLTSCAWALVLGRRTRGTTGQGEERQQ